MDNRYHNYNCPAIMNDGRFLTSHVRSSTMDQYIRSINGINTGHEFRHFLQENGSTLINNIKGYHRQNSTCNVNGQCLPMSGSVNTQSIVNDKSAWYEELLDNDPTQVDYMLLDQ
jgi:hypothetical protein